MLKELLDIAKAAVHRKPKVDPPPTLRYDRNLDEYLMFDHKKNIIDFALAVGTWPSQFITYETKMAYAVWAGHGARTLKKRVN